MNTTFYDILTKHAAMYPDMMPQDWYKLAFQSEFGCGHLLGNGAYERLVSELDSVDYDPNVPLTVDIGGGYTRLDLRAVKGHLAPETVFRLFEDSCETAGTADGFERKLSLTVRAARLGIIKADAGLLDGYFSSADRNVLPSHSENFRERYGAAYRIIKSRFAPLVPAFMLIEGLSARADRLNIAIDGRAAAGKTETAALLASLYGADVIHMDDFFLPKERKTAERLVVPGGNVDSERFYDEVYSHINDSVIGYGIFDCGKQAVTQRVRLERGKILVVEGVYSLLPSLRDRYDIKIFLDTDPVTQRDRIILRGGIRLYERYESEWIPLEERYFALLDPASACDIRIRT